ncbi:MAG: HPr(Ser) kinase/phosphatase [Gemmatimonadales bacterium]|nr:HPr(Ser) kinase/phosphatase [Gemmatimonadales bacterium]
MSLRLRELLVRHGNPLQLESLTGEVGLDRTLQEADISSPGLVLAGYTGRFVPERLHVLGETEISYLSSLPDDFRREVLTKFFSYDLPGVFITKGQSPPEPMITAARDRGIAVLRTALKTAEFYRAAKPIIEAAFAPTTTLHGSLADVYGVGLLFTGRSGIGKSECVLDLVERGHRLVADDVVIATLRGADVLIGRGHDLAAHHMEIRGVGLIDIPALFGIRAVRQQKRIEVIVHLEDWNTAGEVDRTGLSRLETTVLGIKVPKVVVPLNPGKNLTVISEVVAMTHLLRLTGVDSATAFNDRLIKRMKEQRGLREYLQEDYE